MNNTTPSPEIVEKWRAEFEFLLGYSHYEKDCCNEYFDDDIENKWQGFLMARSTVVIPLPAYQPITDNPVYYLGRNKAIDLCVQRIESQGYKTIRSIEC